MRFLKKRLFTLNCLKTLTKKKKNISFINFFHLSRNENKREFAFSAHFLSPSQIWRTKRIKLKVFSLFPSKTSVFLLTAKQKLWYFTTKSYQVLVRFQFPSNKMKVIVKDLSISVSIHQLKTPYNEVPEITIQFELRSIKA